MQQLPQSWPAWDAPEAIAPTVYAVFEDSPWPPAREECPVGTVKVGDDWSVTRGLTGGLLPGQVRGATGMSIGRGSISFPQPDADTIAPWRTGSLGVPAGLLTVRLVAGYDGPTGETLPLGTFVAQARSGSLGGGTVSLDLLETTSRLKAPLLVPRLIDDTNGIDPVWVMDQCARAVGLYSTPAPVASCMVSIPLTGALWAEKRAVTGTIGSWAELDDQVAAQTASLSSTVFMVGTRYVTLSASGPVSITVSAAGVTVVVDPVAGTIKTGTGTQQTFTPGLDPGHPHRVTVRIVTTAAGQVTASAKSAASATYSSTSTQTGSVLLDLYCQITTSAILSGVQISTEDDPALWAPRTARLAASGASVPAVICEPITDAWSVMQQIAAATLGALWLDETGALVYSDHTRMVGSGDVTDEIVVGRRLADLPWTLDPADAADRTAVTCTPPTVQRVTDYSLQVWEATEVTRVAAKATATIVADIEGAVADLAPWQTTTGATIPSTMSQYAAGTAASGGNQVTTGITIDTTIQGTQVVLRVTNTNAYPIWLVDSSGSPALILRANVLARAGEQVTASEGATEDMAETPVTVDLGTWGDEQSAARVLAWLTAQTAVARWRADDVDALLHMGRQAGDVVILTDTDTGLRTKAMLTSVDAKTGALGIAVLDVLVKDRATVTAGLTVAQRATFLTTNLGASATVRERAQWLADRSI